MRVGPSSWGECPYKKRPERSVSLSASWGHSEKAAICKPSALTREESAGTLIWNCPAFRNVRKSMSVVLSHLVYGILFYQPELKLAYFFLLNVTFKLRIIISKYWFDLALELNTILNAYSQWLALLLLGLYPARITTYVQKICIKMFA